MHLRGNTDHNQQAIVEGLRAAFRTVISLHATGNGCPDLLVGFQGANYLLEVKRDKKAKLTPPQVEFFASWRGQRVVVTNLDEAIKATSGYEKRGFSEQRTAGS